jgi:predicted ATPase
MKIPENETLTQAEKNLRGDVPVYKIIITGGPCGGKTTAMARLFSFLRERGFEVITCPEAFTLFGSNGMSLDFFGTEGMDSVIQNSVLDVQLSIEASLERILKGRGKPAVLLCDRGPMDGSAYLSEEKWNKILESRNISVTDLRDTRYNAVFHLVTAADGAPGFYTLENNQVRSETPEQAIEVDRKTQKAWTGHPHMFVFDNSTDFEGKLQRVVERISRIVGLPTNLSRRSAKFLLKARPTPACFPSDVSYHVFEVEKVYLFNQDQDENSYSFIRKRTTIDRKGNKRGSVYQLTTSQQGSSGETIEQKRIITAREYAASYKSRDSSRHVILQQRISFLYKLQSFTVHVSSRPSGKRQFGGSLNVPPQVYETPKAAEGLCILHAQVESTELVAPEVELPPFLDMERRLEGPQDEHDYGAYSLSIIREKE